jgi:hypothetical protein
VSGSVTLALERGISRESIGRTKVAFSPQSEAADGSGLAALFGNQGSS